MDVAPGPQYTLADVAKHTTQAAGVWIAIAGRVYDLTRFLNEVRRHGVP